MIVLHYFIKLSNNYIVMQLISLRIDDTLVEEIDRLIDEGEFDSRASVMRYALRKFFKDGGKRSTNRGSD